MERWSMELERGESADGQIGSRKVRRTAGQADRTTGTRTDSQAGWAAPRAGSYRQVQAEGAEYIAGRGGGGGS